MRLQTVVHTSIAYTRAMHGGLTSSILRAHACLHARKMKIMYVEPMLHACSVKFKLSMNYTVVQGGNIKACSHYENDAHCK